MGEHKKNIKGFHGKGQTCDCCREVAKRKSHKLARQRLKVKDRKLFQEAE